jgi:hypothetical protein
MSRLETAVKPIATPLIVGRLVSLGPEEQKTLAAWIAKTAMMIECADHQLPSSTPAQRRFLMERGEPPAGWQIWIAQYGGENWKAKALRTSTALTAFGTVIEKKLNPPMNTQAITFGVGRLLVQLMATAVPNLSFDIDPKFEPYTPPLWPFRRRVSWPTAHVLNDADAVIFVQRPQQNVEE